MNEKFWILGQNSLRFFRGVQLQVTIGLGDDMAQNRWQMITSANLMMHICLIRLRWNNFSFTVDMFCPAPTISLQWRLMSVMASQITSLTIVYSTVYSGAGQRNHQSSASLAFVRGIHRWPVNNNTEIASICWRHHDIYTVKCRSVIIITLQWEK